MFTRAGSNYTVYELYISIDKTGALNITHRNVDINSVMSRMKLREVDSYLHNYECRVGKYVFTSFDTTSIVYSDDEVNWHNAVTIPDKNKAIMDAEYVRDASLWMDLKLLFQTVIVVFKRKGNNTGKRRKKRRVAKKSKK